MIDKNKKLQLYADLMEEVKLRLNCITIAAQGRTGFPNPIVREMCYLQLRMLCELIALACLVAHGDIKSLQSHQIGKSTGAQDILSHLERLRPHFYPAASKEVRGHNKMIEELKESPLPKSELIRLYGSCHKHLHRGSLKKLLSSKAALDLVVDIPEIIQWAQKINDLLQIHIIYINDDEILGCILRCGNMGNPVQVFAAEALKM